MDYNELYEKYNELIEENKRLTIENNNFRERLGLPLLIYHMSDDVQVSKKIENISPEQSTELKHITNNSSPQDKIDLFISLFRGREDVYAKRWQNKEGKSGYSPVCLNEWAKGVCNKAKIKCSACTNRDYAVLDSAAIDKHLRGCELDLANLLNTQKVNVKWNDESNGGKSIKVEFNGQLRGEQEDAVNSMLQYDNGVLSATTAFGKTVVGAKLISARKVDTLVLVHTQQLLEQQKERLNQFLIIAGALEEVLPNVITLTGGMSAKERKEALIKLSSIPEKSNFVIVATGRFVGEGFDEPRLDTLFLAMPVAWKGTVQQYAGRLHRLYQNKSEVQIYDYVDVHVGVLERMYHKRLRGYASIGYSAKGDSRPFEAVNSIFDSHNFLTVFSNDISSAKSEIVIVSPYITKKRLSQMLKILLSVINNGTKLTI